MASGVAGYIKRWCGVRLHASRSTLPAKMALIARQRDVSAPGRNQECNTVRKSHPQLEQLPCWNNRNLQLDFALIFTLKYLNDDLALISLGQDEGTRLRWAHDSSSTSRTAAV